MSALDSLRTFAFLGLPAGLVLGLLLGLVARRQDGWGGYGSFRRRAARLGHVSVVMLPLIAGFYAMTLEGRAFDTDVVAWAARLWIAGATLLSLSLFAAAWRPALLVALPLPALAVTAGAALFASAWLGG